MTSNTSTCASSLVGYTLQAVRSVLGKANEISMAELSQTLPARPVEQVMPLSVRSR